MTQLANAEADLPTVSQLDRSYVDWAAVTGGALVAVVVFTTLTAFGSALGLSLTSAQPGQGISAKLAAIAIALWMAWTAALSFAAGGYIVGRLRHKIPDATEHEVRMRDGANGLIAWSVAGIISGLLLASSVGAAATSAAKEAANTMQEYQVGLLFRGETTSAEGARRDSESVLKTITARKALSESDEEFLAQLVSRATSISVADAKARVISVERNIQSSLDQARGAGVLAAFLTAASLAIGAAAAWSAAIAGGKQRDEGAILSPLTKWA
jgi:hypothetical protein